MITDNGSNFVKAFTVYSDSAIETELGRDVVDPEKTKYSVTYHRTIDVLHTLSIWWLGKGQTNSIFGFDKYF